MNLLVIGANGMFIEEVVNFVRIIFNDDSVFQYSKDDTSNLVVNLSEVTHLEFN